MPWMDAPVFGSSPTRLILLICLRPAARQKPDSAYLSAPSGQTEVARVIPCTSIQYDDEQVRVRVQYCSNGQQNRYGTVRTDCQSACQEAKLAPGGV